MSIKECIKPHILVYSSLLNLLSWATTDMKKFNAFNNQVAYIDSILEYEEFCDCMKQIKNKSEYTLPRVHKYGQEAVRHYGYYQEILKYANANETQIVLLTSLEHGIRFGSKSWMESDTNIPYSISCVCQGPGRSAEVHDFLPWKPVFVFGPYIHYASNYYSGKQMRQLKERFGRVLLIFPSHTWERGIPGSDPKNLFKIIYEKYAYDYDTILVCSYWNDVDSPILDDYKKYGAKLISAGYRSDPNFIRRLKSIITLSDCIVVDDLGTNIGFGIYLGKPVFLESSTPRSSDDRVLAANFNRFHEAFYSPDKTFTAKQLEKQKELYRFFWGGEEYLKSPKEIREILGVLQEMCKATHYNINKMPGFIRKKCLEFPNEHRYQILADSVDPSVWSSS